MTKRSYDFWSCLESFILRAVYVRSRRVPTTSSTSSGAVRFYTTSVDLSRVRPHTNRASSRPTSPTPERDRKRRRRPGARRREFAHHPMIPRAPLAGRPLTVGTIRGAAAAHLSSRHIAVAAAASVLWTRRRRGGRSRRARYGRGAVRHTGGVPRRSSPSIAHACGVMLAGDVFSRPCRLGDLRDGPVRRSRAATGPTGWSGTDPAEPLDRHARLLHGT